MHTFQTYPSDMFEIDPFTKIGSEWMLITSGNREKANALTASWGGLGFLWGKNVAFICKKMAAVPITKDMFIDMDIDEKWYSKANLDDYHTMYIGEITDILAR